MRSGQWSTAQREWYVNEIVLLFPGLPMPSALKKKKMGEQASVSSLLERLNAEIDFFFLQERQEG